MEKKISLDGRIRKIAESGKAVGMPKGFTTPQNKETRLLHIDICKQLAELSNENGNYPLGYLVYFAVGKNAHRLNVFFNGYKSINVDKAKRILSWAKEFARYNNNPKLQRNSELAHALCRFYETRSTKTKDFRSALACVEPNAKSLKFADYAKALGVEK